MNIANLVTALQVAASNATTTIDYMMLSKMIEKLNVGSVTTVATSSNLPSTLATNGNVYYVTANQEHYYNVGSAWKPFSGIYGVPYAWGLNGKGQLGDKTITSKSSPVTVVGNLLRWISLTAGSEHSLGIVEPGIAYAWGDNTSQVLGLGDDLTSKSSPVTVVGGITNWIQLSTNTGLIRNHTLGITSTGIAYAWGGNNFGQLGDNTTSTRNSPVTVVGGITNWSQVSAGGQHSLGVTSTGIAYAWGTNQYGQLGDGTTISKRFPVVVAGSITNWSQVAGGNIHSLGLTSTGIIYAWGNNLSGQLGDGTTSSRTSPVTVVGGITNWNQVSGCIGAGGSSGIHSLGIRTPGLAYAWGSNGSGRLGDNTTSARSSPVTVVGGISNWSQISGGTQHSLALTTSGTLYGWGENGSGQLGNDAIADRSSPVTVIGGITTWALATAGGSHGLAVQSFTA